ncbi:MAG TPA: DUF1080 domain-containing protein [Candidatus Paceibacterota bacterium]|nr:DUF1080 domain-containing protein [Verrucomicrobiota bacterium]HRY47942.1 DUF1080 domain-containing protein [Candidatus Paceibacterota bacterium]HSA03390.1 DUF1080 domain-containing protein [Candidatus Paceibacterota bacterium]
MIRKSPAVFACAILALSAARADENLKWISLFNGKDLSGWTVRGEAIWSVQDGILVGLGGMEHIYSEARCSSFEAKEL